MYVCMYVCMYMYMYMSICMYMYIFIYLYTYADAVVSRPFLSPDFPGQSLEPRIESTSGTGAPGA